MTDQTRDSGQVDESEYTIEEAIYHYLVLEGSSYEVGIQLAEYVKLDAVRREFFTSAKLDIHKLGFKSFQLLQEYYEECCPGIIEEIQGLADGLEVSPEQVPLWKDSVGITAGSNCSQLLVLPSASADNHLYLGRSYEWIHTEEDLVLCTTRVDGKASHIGFTSLLSGRQEGMNEHGLIVSMTGAGIPNQKLKHKGFVFWIAIRSLLDSCRSVDAALERLETLPLSGHFNLILADRKDHAALLEYADGIMAVKRITGESPSPFLFSTNHYQLPETKQFNNLCVIIGHSRHRASLISSMIRDNMPCIAKDAIRSLLAANHPDGLCNHFYNDYFGTTWSMILDSTTLLADVCFSAPTHNAFRAFNLSDSVGLDAYPAVIPISKQRLPL
ncbi:MAG: C45 family autoproteolytic acyltransferase/hydrolase [Candidatus Thorarchaeota archaeon]